MAFFLETFLGGLMAGMLYALVALGFVLIFKASGVFNFAQGIMVVFAALTLVGRQAGLGTYYWTCVGIAVLLVGYQFAIARCREPEWCFRAFLHNHWVGMAIFAGIAAHFALANP